MSSDFPKPTLQSAYAYTPKFELWYNGLMWQAIYNCINSFNLSETESRVIPSIGPMTTVKVGPERFKYNVALLRSMIISGWEDEQFNKDEKLSKNEPMKMFSAILNLLHRKGHLRFKPPRDFADD